MAVIESLNHSQCLALSEDGQDQCSADDEQALDHTRDSVTSKIDTLLAKLKGTYGHPEACVKNSIQGLSPGPQVNFLEMLTKMEDGKWQNLNSSVFLEPRIARLRPGMMQDSIHKATSELREDLQKKRGWCPSTVNFIVHAIHVPGLYLASLVIENPSGTYKRLATESEPTLKSFHGSCGHTECLKITYDDSLKSRRRHISDSCTCEEFKVDEAKLDQIISDGHTPTVMLPSSANAGERLKIVRTTSQARDYITISYVWSQFHPMTHCRLKEAVDTIPRSMKGTNNGGGMTKIWLDILCVPQDECKYSRSKRSALDSIPNIYENASLVLVIDDLLVEADPKASAMILGIKILATEWMRRVWTLQEAARATLGSRKLAFLVGNEVKIFDDIKADLEKDSWALSDLVRKALDDRLTFANESIEIPSLEVFNRLFIALEYRNCRDQEDEALCMAAILSSPPHRCPPEINWKLTSDMAQEQVTKEELSRRVAGERMAQLFLWLKEFPLALIFCQGLRVEKPAFRWLPYSFIARSTQRRSTIKTRPKKNTTKSKESTTNPEGYINAICGMDGLRFTAPADVFTLDTQGNSVFCKNHLSVLHYVSQCRNGLGFEDNRMERRIERTKWEQYLEEENAMPEDQGWKKLYQVKKTHMLALITNDCSARPNEEGILLRIKNPSQINTKKVETEFICRVYIGNDRAKEDLPKEPEGASIESETLYTEVQAVSKLKTGSKQPGAQNKSYHAQEGADKSKKQKDKRKQKETCGEASIIEDRDSIIPASNAFKMRDIEWWINQ